MLIHSSDNPKVKSVRKFLENSKHRKESDCYILESAKPIFEIFHNDPDDIEFFLCHENFLLPQEVEENFSEIYRLETKLFNQISSLKSPQGILAKIKKRVWEAGKILKSIQSAVILDGISDPQNFGSIVRNGTAFDIGAVFFTIGSVDHYHPLALRAAAGNIHTMPILELSESILDFMNQNKFSFYSFSEKANLSLDQAHFDEKSIFIFGSEGQGVLSPMLKALPKLKPIRIEIKPKVDSLNVAVSTGIVFFMFNQKKRV